MRLPRNGTLFITGTDTGIGKTTVACALIRLAREQGIKVCGWKPVATGCERGPKGLRNADALALQKAAGTREPYQRLNPYAFEPAIAPHLAAQAAGREIRIAELDRVHAELAKDYELIVVEGAGGWMVPLNQTWTFASWVAEREWPVLLVVGMRLGCLNHTLLTVESIRRCTQLTGWVANALPPAMAKMQENVEALQRRLSAPLWKIFRTGGTQFQQADAAGQYLKAMASRS